MGRPKAQLEFGEVSLLERVHHRLRAVVRETIVVAAEAQSVPSMRDCAIIRDEMEFAGPLAGIALGLTEARRRGWQMAYVTSCDVPFLQPDFISALVAATDGYDVAVPFDEHHVYPLAAVYKTHVSDAAKQLLESGARRPRDLFDRVKTRRVPTSELDVADRGLHSLINVNTPADYRAALRQADLPIPEWLPPLE